MTLSLKTRVRDAELSVKTIAALVRKYGESVTLGDMRSLPDQLWPETLGRRGRKELNEAIDFAGSQDAAVTAAMRVALLSIRDPGRRALQIGADAAMQSVPEMSQHDCNVDADMMAAGFAAVIDELLKGEG